MSAATTRPARPRHQPRHGPPGDLSVLERIAVAALGLGVTAAGLVWTTAQVTARAMTGEWLPISFSQMGPVLGRVVDRPGDPAAAFGPALTEQLPAAGVFWVVAAVLACLPLVLVVWWRHRRGASTHDIESARWATATDLKRLLVRRPVPGRLTIGRGPGRRLVAAEPGHSLLILGPTQSGKTSGLAVPAIREWPGPVVATSVKTDLLTDTVDDRRERGTVWTYDPTGSVTGVPHAGWTPLANCHTWAGALRTAAWLSDAARDRTLSESQFWYANAEKLLAPLLFAAATAGLTMTDVVRWVDVQDHEEVRLLLEAAGDPGALSAAAATWGREDRTRSAVYTTAETVLAAFADPTVAVSSTQCDIDPQQLLDGGAHTLYVCAPLHEQARLRPLFTSLVQQVLVAAYERAAISGRLEAPLLLVLDEAANIAPLKDLAQVASTAAGLGIQLVTIWQDRAQIVARYGDAAATVVNNHRAKLVLSGITDAGTTGDISQVIGETETTRQSTSIDADGRTTATRAPQSHMLATAAGIRQLNPFEGVLVYGHLPPARVKLRAPT